jgi:hypothetical protein
VSNDLLGITHWLQMRLVVDVRVVTPKQAERGTQVKLQRLELFASESHLQVMIFGRLANCEVSDVGH